MSKSEIKGLTLRHPWAFAFQYLSKDVENRTWHPSRMGGQVGMYIALHGGAAKPTTYALEMFGALRWFQEIELIPDGPVKWNDFVSPGIVAVAKLTGVTRASPSVWAVEGQYHWCLEVTPLPEPVPHKGAQGLWAIEPDALAEVKRQFKHATAEARSARVEGEGHGN